MSNKSNFWLPLAIGAAVGAAVTYLLTSDKKEEIVEDLKDAARKAKSELEDLVKKAGGTHSAKS